MKLRNGIYLVGSGQCGISHHYDCHVYLIDGGEELALVDAGGGEAVERIVSNIEEEGFDPSEVGKVFLTHSHADHIGGAGKLKDLLDCQLYALNGAAGLIESGGDEELGLELAKSSGVYEEDYEYPHTEVENGLEGGDRIPVGGLEVEVLHVPGHSKYSACYHFEIGEYSGLFSGDVVLLNGQIGLLNCPGSSLKDYRDHFNKLADLAIDGLYPGHKLFVLNGGQDSIDAASEALQKLAVPPTFF